MSSTSVGPAESALTSCTDATPVRPSSIDTSLAQDFGSDRVQRTVTLDGGDFQAAPPSDDAHPAISGAEAFCNILAGVVAGGYSVRDVAHEHGLSFGLGLVTVADSLIAPGALQAPYPGYNGLPHVAESAFHDRLSWVAIVRPDLVASCPAETAPAPASPQPSLPGYVVVAIDAQTGASGIVYDAEANQLCGEPGTRPPSVEPAVESVSVPWRLVSRGPDSHSDTISYQSRSCDEPITAEYDATHQPAVWADRSNPALVAVEFTRIITACSPPTTHDILLRSSTKLTTLPAQLQHAPVGALDTE